MLDRYSRECIIRMIELYESKNGLWNPLDPQFKSANYKKQAYVEILESLVREFPTEMHDKTTAELRRKYKNLRGVWLKNYKILTRNAPDPISPNLECPSLFYFDKYSFLIPVITEHELNESSQNHDDISEHNEPRPRPTRYNVRKKNAVEKTNQTAIRTPELGNVNFSYTPTMPLFTDELPLGSYSSLTSEADNDVNEIIAPVKRRRIATGDELDDSELKAYENYLKQMVAIQNKIAHSKCDALYQYSSYIKKKESLLHNSEFQNADNHETYTLQKSGNDDIDWAIKTIARIGSRTSLEKTEELKGKLLGLVKEFLV